jgi:hypothetical protein
VNTPAAPKLFDTVIECPSSSYIVGRVYYLVTPTFTTIVDVVNPTGTLTVLDGALDGVLVNIGSVFLTVIVRVYVLDNNPSASLSTTERIVGAETRVKLVSGGEIVAMKEGGSGAAVRAIVTQATAGVNVKVTVEGL